MERAEHKFKTVNVKGGKAYVEVKDRILYLAETFNGDYSIATDYQYFPDRKMWVVKATLTLKQGEITSTYTGLAQELEGGNGVNSTSALENAETSAVGRACAMAGIGVMEAIASADEVNKAQNRAAKVEPVKAPSPSHVIQQTSPAPGKAVPANQANVLPNDMLQKLSQELEQVKTEDDFYLLWGNYEDYKGHVNIVNFFAAKAKALGIKKKEAVA